MTHWEKVMNLRKKFCGLRKTSKTLAQLLSRGTMYLSLLRNMNLTLKHNRRRKFIAAAKGKPLYSSYKCFSSITTNGWDISD